MANKYLNSAKIALASLAAACLTGCSTPYYNNMTQRSAILDEEGYLIGDKLKSGFGEHFSDIGKTITNKYSKVGYTQGKSSERINQAGSQIKDAGSDVLYFFTGSLAGNPSIMNKQDSNGNKQNKFVAWLASPVQAVYNTLGSAVNTLDTVAAGTINLTLGTAGNVAKNTLELAGDTIDTTTGLAIVSPIQGLEDLISGSSSNTTYVARGINSGIGLATRYIRNVLTFESMRNGCFDNNGNYKGIVGPTLEIIGDYGLLLGNSSGGNSKKEQKPQETNKTPVRNQPKQEPTIVQETTTSVTPVTPPLPPAPITNPTDDWGSGSTVGY